MRGATLLVVGGKRYAVIRNAGDPHRVFTDTVQGWRLSWSVGQRVTPRTSEVLKQVGTMREPEPPRLRKLSEGSLAYQVCSYFADPDARDEYLLSGDIAIKFDVVRVQDVWERLKRAVSQGFLERCTVVTDGRAKHVYRAGARITEFTREPVRSHHRKPSSSQPQGASL